jgi:hypothetical protein
MPKKRNQKKGTPVNDLSRTHSLIDTTKGPANAGPLERALVVKRGIRSFRSRIAAEHQTVPGKPGTALYLAAFKEVSLFIGMGYTKGKNNS